jgi:hypothetical protein
LDRRTGAIQRRPLALQASEDKFGAYYSIPSGGERSVNASWTYEAPCAAVSEIKEYLAFYPDRVDAFQITVKD